MLFQASLIMTEPDVDFSFKDGWREEQRDSGKFRVFDPMAKLSESDRYRWAESLGIYWGLTRINDHRVVRSSPHSSFIDEMLQARLKPVDYDTIEYGAGTRVVDYKLKNKYLYKFLHQRLPPIDAAMEDRILAGTM